MPFKWSLMADVSSVVKGGQDVEKVLTEMGDSLDKLGSETASTADEAAGKLESEFKQAFDKVQSEAKTTGKRIGDDLDDGARRAKDGVEDFKGEAASTAREAAASFDGSAESIADAFQEVAANAFGGFGPAGAAAGLAAAAGIGLASAALTQAEEEAQEAREAALELGQAFATAASRAEALADATSDALAEMVKTPETFFDQTETDRLTLYSQMVREAGLDYNDVLLAMQGDTQAYDRVVSQAWANTAAEHEQATISFITDLDRQRQKTVDAEQWAQNYADSQVAAQRQVAEAQQHARDVAADWAESLADHLNVAAGGLDGFVKKGKLDLAEWAKEVKARTREVARVEDFKIDVFPKLSPEAQESFAQLPVETQAQIAKAYRDGSKKDKRKILATLQAEVKLDTKVTETKLDPVSIPTKVDADKTAAQVAAAADAGQREANRRSNEIEIGTRIDTGELQRQVNRAAATITPPTVWVNLKPRKEVP